MATLTVSLPDEVVARLREKLEPHGYSVEEFATSSLSGFADMGEFISNELETQLLQALSSPLLLVLTAIVAGVGIVALIIVGFG